jgi:3-oxoadipate enol-lactonase
LKKTINGIQMYYIDEGSGPAVLLVHGFPFDHTMWHNQVAALRANYRLIVPDLRGHGQSQATSNVYRMDLMADDLRALLHTLDIEQVVLGGLSMGGYIAFAFWRIYPHLVRGLVLADTRAAADTPEARQSRERMVELVQRDGTGAIANEMVPRLLSETTLMDRPEVVDHARRMIVRMPVAGIVGALQGMAQRPDSTPTLSTITVPTLIAVGEDDTLTPPDEAEEMRSAIVSGRHADAPDVVLARIPQAGHLSPLENHLPFSAALREFLAGI